MFRDKTFNLAFLISLSWHLFCMFCITIVILPANFPIAKASSVSFLGPILEKTAFELMLERKIPTRRTSYREPMYFDGTFLTKDEKGIDKLKFDNYFLTGKREEIKPNAKDLFGDFKFTPSFSQGTLNKPSAKGPRLEGGGDGLFIEGPLAKREILFKPELPVLAKRIEPGQESFVVELKFKVSSKGSVDEVLLLASSGYPDVDMAAIGYIKGFQFSPLSRQDTPLWDKIRLTLKTK